MFTYLFKFQSKKQAQESVIYASLFPYLEIIIPWKDRIVLVLEIFKPYLTNIHSTLLKKNLVKIRE